MNKRQADHQYADNDGGLAFFLLFSAFLHVMLLLLPLGSSANGKGALSTLPSKAEKNNLPLSVKSLSHAKMTEPLAAIADNSALPFSRRDRFLPVELAETKIIQEPNGPVGVPAFPVYFNSSALTNPPGLHTLGATEPDEDHLMPGGGRVVIELFLSDTGEVDHWEIVEDTSPPAFLDHVLKIFLTARYTPGMLFQMPVRSRLKVEATLSPSEKYSP